MILADHEMRLAKEFRASWDSYKREILDFLPDYRVGAVKRFRQIFRYLDDSTISLADSVHTVDAWRAEHMDMMLPNLGDILRQAIDKNSPANQIRKDIDSVIVILNRIKDNLNRI